MKIGVILDSFRLPFFEALTAASKLGVEGIQFYARSLLPAGTPGDFNLLEADDDSIAACKKACDEAGLVITAVCGDVFELSFQVEKETMLRAEALKNVVDRAHKLGVGIITTHIGHVPESTEDPVFDVMVKGVREAAEYAASKGCCFAIETGPELACVLKNFIETVNSPGLKVNLDPANLRGVSGEDPVFAAETLGPYIVHTHGKDAIMTHPGSAASFYKLRNTDGSYRKIAARPAGFQEVPLGEGQVPWEPYIAALKKAGFDGFITIERECGDDPAADIAAAVDFLKARIK